MSANTQKSLQVDILAAKQIVSRNQNNTIADDGYVLTADGKGGSSWVANNASATNAFGAVVVNNPATAIIHAKMQNRVGTTLQLVASDPITLTGNTALNQVIVGVNTAAFITETSKRFPTDDFFDIGPGSLSITIDCQYKLYKLRLDKRPYTIEFTKTNIPVGKACSLRLFIETNSIGPVGGQLSPTITWSNTTVRFQAPYNVTPYNASSTAGLVDIIELTTFDRGTTWYGNVIAKGV